MDTVAETTNTVLSPPGYELLDEIGHGGMGVFYRVRDVALDRDVAVQLLSDWPIYDSAGQFAISVEAPRMIMVRSSLQRLLESSYSSRRPTPHRFSG